MNDDTQKTPPSTETLELYQARLVVEMVDKCSLKENPERFMKLADNLQKITKELVRRTSVRDEALKTARLYFWARDRIGLPQEQDEILDEVKRAVF